MSPLPPYRRTEIYHGEASERVLCVPGDINGDGNPEIVIASRAPRPDLRWIGREPDGTWRSYLMDDAFDRLEAGGFLYDIDGDGRLDFIGGGDHKGNLLYWWQCPSEPRQRWTRRVICEMPKVKSHDQLVADLDGDGRGELYFWNQGNAALMCAPIPANPRVEPWPGVYAVATGVTEEGLAVADIDGDGRLELVAGQSWYKRRGDGTWQRHAFAEGFVSTRLACADFDGDGRVEIAVSEGDASLNKRTYGRLAIFKAGADVTQLWSHTVLHNRLLDPHTLEVADFDEDGRPDLLVGELGDPWGKHLHPPAVRIYQNTGNSFREHIIEEGIGIHEGRAIRIDGKWAIVGKPFQVVRDDLPRETHVDAVHLWTPEQPA